MSAEFCSVDAPLAQLVEHRTFNPWVVGSSPTGRTVKAPHLVQQVRGLLVKSQTGTFWARFEESLYEETLHPCQAGNSIESMKVQG